jgi:hypothetical protein
MGAALLVVDVEAVQMMEVDLKVNTRRIGRVIVTRIHPDGGPPDRVHTYTWRYSRDGQHEAVGTVEHRYGDGAVELAHKVLGELAKRHRIAQAPETKTRRRARK